ncbi:hypothetical protein ACFY64_31925 [Streptomyces collinus]|uniref:hypothetical protein n=1 Tax=Streptomyces collinus TaxID=42684 RepID=UPI003687A193
MPDRIAGRIYEFRVAGPVSKDMAETFCELHTAVIGTQTMFYGPVVDEAHLLGLLDRFRSCGLLLIEMRPRPT